eukprot:CAMPEP_0181537652 /NCGR_PEP_ID=MMETSP1110-20121109/75461_1 /TAXON_ID=174948 /ORGANISM="Symbiodinium sp., Strain CCMP421" /LENGTH=65 /DNA_ID=CAMNT_0023669229 /DNA_START=382 /DNA_END=575 /DNA_ORIENTATION=-
MLQLLQPCDLIDDYHCGVRGSIVHQLRHAVAIHRLDLTLPAEALEDEVGGSTFLDGKNHSRVETV